jgi:hypothetical protein
MAVRLFISCVSDEFGGYRDSLRRALTRPNVEVKIQEDFKPLGGDTLNKLEDYIASSEAVVHFVGEVTGSAPPDFCVRALRARHPDLAAKLPPLAAPIEAGAAISYTQWEAWLAAARIPFSRSCGRTQREAPDEGPLSKSYHRSRPYPSPLPRRAGEGATRAYAGSR